MATGRRWQTWSVASTPPLPGGSSDAAHLALPSRHRSGGYRPASLADATDCLNVEMKQRPSVSNQPFDGNQLPAVLDAVWRNTHWVDNALGLYEGVSKHADQVDKNYGRFFGLVQRFSLYEAALGI